MQLKDWARENKGALPTYSQTQTLWGYSSSGSVSYMLKVLLVNGYIKKQSWFALTAKGKKAKYK